MEVVRKTDAAMWKRLFIALRTMGKKDLKVGWFSTNRYDDDKATPVAYIATIHEFGSEKAGIPARPFMRPTVTREEQNWRRFIALETKKILAGGQTIEGLFEALGLGISGEIGRSIMDVTEPKLDDATIRAKMKKKSDKSTQGSLGKPLIETKLMYNSVTYTVGDSPATPPADAK